MLWSPVWWIEEYYFKFYQSETRITDGNLITWSYVKYLALIAYVDVGPSTLLWLPQWHPLKRIMMFLSQCSRDQSRCFFVLYTESDQQLIWFCFIYMLKLRLCFCNKIEKQNTTPLEHKYNTSRTQIQHL
jgi:hypothetical protein